MVLEWQDKENLSGAKEEAEEFLAQQRKLVKSKTQTLNPRPQTLNSLNINKSLNLDQDLNPNLNSKP